MCFAELQNICVQKVLSMLLGDGCNGRLHWGKCGWPRYESCFDGAASFPETWCSFGCAVQVGSPSCLHCNFWQEACEYPDFPVQQRPCVESRASTERFAERGNAVDSN